MLYLMLLYLVILYLFRKKINEKIIIVLSVIPFLLIIWTRYGLGADYFAYQDMYNKLEVQSLGSLFNNYYGIEVGFKLLMWPFRLLHIPFWLFLGLINTAVTIILLKWIDDNSDEPSLSILLFYSMFFLVWVLSALRQSIVLSIGLYLLFNKKIKLNFYQTIILILVLFSIHNSALFLLVFLIMGKLNWTKRLHVVFMSTAILTSFLPMDRIISLFRFLPGVGKIVNSYLDSASVFYDFPGLIRLGMFVIVLYFYDSLKDKKNITDAILYGFSTYFLLKFSEITASRATIFTFFLILIIVPNILKSIDFHFNHRLVNSVILPVFVVFGSTVYFSKEFNTMINQTEYLGEVTLMTYPNIFSKDISQFGSLQAYETGIQEAAKEYYSQYKSDERDRTVVEYDSSQTYKTLKFKNSYSIIDQNGNYLREEKHKDESTVIDGVLSTKKYKKHHFFDYIELIDLTGENRSEEELQSVFTTNFENEQFNRPTEIRVGNEKSLIPEEFKKFYPVESEINRVILNKIEGPLEYHVMRVDYKERTSFIFFDSEMNLLLPFPSKVANKYNNEGFLQLSINDIPMIINRDGQIIWWGELK